MGCKDCEVQVTAAFPASRLASLSIEHQRFIEMFVLSSGSLKAIAQRAEVSYPTVRSRLDRVIEALRKEVESHREGSATLEDSVEETARLLKRI